MPTVTSFKGKSDLGGGKSGLHLHDKSPSNVEITGTDFQLGMDVKVIMGPNDQGIRWSGKLDSVDGTVYKSRLTCTNPWDRGGGGHSDVGGAVGLGTGGGEGDDISVTVGSSTAYKPPASDVPTGP